MNKLAKFSVVDIIKNYKLLIVLGAFYSLYFFLLAFILAADASFLISPIKSIWTFYGKENITISIISLIFISLWGVIVGVGSLYYYVSSSLISDTYKRLVEVVSIIFSILIAFKYLPLTYPSINTIKLQDNHAVFNTVKHIFASFFDIFLILPFAYTVLAVFQSIIFYIVFNNEIRHDN